MQERITLTHKFVEYIPEVLEEGVLYISIDYATVVHACCCGCGNQVVTPLSPTGWKLIFDGETISLKPSVGNWSFPCQSHYWITRSTVAWAAQWSNEKIVGGRARDARERERYFDRMDGSAVANIVSNPEKPEATTLKVSLRQKLKQIMQQWFSAS